MRKYFVVHANNESFIAFQDDHDYEYDTLYLASDYPKFPSADAASTVVRALNSVEQKRAAR